MPLASKIYYDFLNFIKLFTLTTYRVTSKMISCLPANDVINCKNVEKTPTCQVIVYVLHTS